MYILSVFLAIEEAVRNWLGNVAYIHVPARHDEGGHSILLPLISHHVLGDDGENTKVIVCRQ